MLNLSPSEQLADVTAREAAAFVEKLVCQLELGLALPIYFYEFVTVARHTQDALAGGQSRGW